LLNKQGYMSTSLSEIMAVTGKKKGSLLNHFQNKEELVSLAFGHCLNIFKQYIQNAISTASTANDRLLAFIDAFCSFDENTLPGGCPIINVTVEIYDGLSERLQEQAKEGMDFLINLCAGILEKGVLEGEFKPHVDANQVASSMISACEGGLLLSKLLQNPSHSRYVRDLLGSFVTKEIKNSYESS
jgi:TetR/AcrR family transcriptional repressor of nem operon